MKDIILLGQALIDYLCKADDIIDRYDLEKGKANHKDFSDIKHVLADSTVTMRSIGGCVTNTAIGLHKLGVQSYLVCCIGDDGLFYSDSIKKFDRIVPVESKLKGNTGVVATYIDEIDNNNPRTSIYNHGCSNRLQLPGILMDRLKGSIVYMSMFSLWSDHYYMIDVLDTCNRLGAVVIFDAGGCKGIDSVLLREALSYSDMVIANNHEIESVGYGGWRIVKNGSGPTGLYVDGTLELEVEVNRSDSVVNCLGAGDAFAAGFLKTYASGSSFRESIAKGNSYARTVVERKEFH